jgi:CrcB protein
VNAVEWVAVAATGGLGAVARFGLDRGVSTVVRGGFPAGTLLVILSGCLLLGLLSGLAVDDTVDLVVGTAVIGSFTTFSTWVFETQRLAEERRLRLAGWNLVLSVGLGLLAAWVGREIGPLL